ncbi:MAG: hypothetical protein JO276_00595 [Sphingomonadaceae bacterium]|nr:hypothetical protein [Sphingomonadaceae bacterium]
MLQAPPNAASAAPALSTVGWSDPSPSERVSGIKLAGIFCLTLVALLCVDALLSNTSLITPISSTFVNVMRGVGLAFGIPLALLVVFSPAIPLSMFRKAMALVCVPLLTAFAGGEAAYRIADWIEFPFSSAPFAPASYPITHASLGRKGRRDSVEIDPFDLGDGTSIALPRDQFETVWNSAGAYCITVMQRRSASGAIEIRNDGVYNLSPPAPAVLTPCAGTKRVQ